MSNTNYMQVKPDSHYWTSIEMLLNYLGHHVNGNVPANYLIIGLENTREAGYTLAPDQPLQGVEQGKECEKCNGSGLVNEPGKPEKHDCAYCDGTGRINQRLNKSFWSKAVLNKIDFYNKYHFRDGDTKEPLSIGAAYTKLKRGGNVEWLDEEATEAIPDAVGFVHFILQERWLAGAGMYWTQEDETDPDKKYTIEQLYQLYKSKS